MVNDPDHLSTSSLIDRPGQSPWYGKTHEVALWFDKSHRALGVTLNNDRSQNADRNPFSGDSSATACAFEDLA